jgi:hypothetical protein
MLVKINNLTRTNVNVTELDIDEFGTLIPIRDLELKIVEHNNNLYELLKQSAYAAIFTEKDLNSKFLNEQNHDKKNSNIILLVNPITIDELNSEKRKIIESMNKAKKDNQNRIT